MISWQILLIISVFLFIFVCYLLKKWNKINYDIPFIGYRMAGIAWQLSLIMVYAYIYNLGYISDTLYLEKSDYTKGVGLLFSLLYAILFIFYAKFDIHEDKWK